MNHLIDIVEFRNVDILDMSFNDGRHINYMLKILFKFLKRYIDMFIIIFNKSLN